MEACPNEAIEIRIINAGKYKNVVINIKDKYLANTICALEMGWVNIGISN
ncbi:hypothetical protein [Spiroplasma endosymbiont of Cantharis nigra]